MHYVHLFGVNNDRPLQVPGVTYERNYFRNRGIYDVDLRLQKGFKFGEDRRLIFTSEFFNILNRANIIFPTPNTGAVLINNVNPGSQVFQMQLGMRFQF